MQNKKLEKSGDTSQEACALYRLYIVQYLKLDGQFCNPNMVATFGTDPGHRTAYWCCCSMLGDCR